MKNLLFLLLVLLTTNILGQEIPKNKGFVSDYENLFTSEQKSELTNILSNYEKQTTIEIFILTVSDFESDIADYAQNVATDWKVGKKDINNGLLIVISKNKGVLRSQTGYGLEGYLPDGWLKHTGDSIVYKYFKDDLFYDGTINYISQIEDRIGSEGYSEDHNEELIKAQKESDEEQSILGWMIENVPWYVWVGILFCWFILFLIWPEGALWIVYILLSGGKSGSSGGGGGSFGGGGSHSRF